MRIEAMGRIVAMAVFIVGAWVVGARAATSCTLPEAYPITLEARGAVLGVGRGVVASAQSSDRSPLAPGDAIRQVNGVSVETCADVERAAAEGFAKGLPLLLAVERPTGLVAVLVSAQELGADEPEAPAAAAEPAGVVEPTPAVRPAARNLAVVSAVPVADEEVPASARALAVVSPSEGTSNGSGRTTGAERAVAGVASGLPAEKEGSGHAVAVAMAAPLETRRELPPLPGVASVRAELRQAAEQATALLRALEAHATVAVPLAIYQLDYERTDAAIHDIDFGAGDGTAAVRGLILDILDAYGTAREILIAKVEYQIEMHQKMRTRAPREMPYFSDGDVPHWVASFPFLHEAVLEPPTDRRFIQSAGRWSPDRAVALLWEHASDETARLASWNTDD